MGRHNRKCYTGILNHSYQNTIDGKQLFYSVSDFLVYFTILCVIVPRHKVRLLAVTLMYDHIHKSVVAESRLELFKCSQNVTSVFVREHNKTLGRKGPLFNKPFGSVPKNGDKKARSNLIYLANNPVERRMVIHAEDYRWNFIAYAVSDHPFSEPIEHPSKFLKWSLDMVKRKHDADEYLTAPLLRTMFRKLNRDESEQLVDYIVSTYNIIDYAEAIRFWGSYDKMLTAIHSTTGEEYDLNEKDVGVRDDVYPKLCSSVLKQGRIKDIHQVVSLPDDEKLELFKFLLGKTEAQPRQIAKFLHLPLPHVIK